MGVAAALGRSSAIAAGTLVLGGLLRVAYITGFCPKARMAEKVARHETVVIDSGYRFAIPGEMTVTCTAPHRLGPLTFHDDFDCYCVPVSTDVPALAREIGGSCTVDKPNPLHTDATGTCRHAHCVDFE